MKPNYKFKYIPKIDLSNCIGSDDPTVCPICKCISLKAGKLLGYGYYRELKRSYSSGLNRIPDGIMIAHECPHCYEKICFHVNMKSGHVIQLDELYRDLEKQGAFEKWENGEQPMISDFGNCHRCRIECSYKGGKNDFNTN